MTLGKLGYTRGTQPPRAPDDHEYVGLRVQGDKLVIVLGPLGDGPPTQEMVISERNAWTLVGLIGFFVGFRLPKKLAERIMLR